MTAITHDLIVPASRDAAPASRAAVLRGLMRSIQFAVGAVLIWAGVIKLHPAFAFLETVYAYQMLSPRAGLALAIVLPAAEIIVGVCLVGGIMLGGATLSAAILSLMFVVAQFHALRQGLSIDCGCFAAADADHAQRITHGTFARALLLLVASVAAFVMLLREPGKETVDAPH